MSTATATATATTTSSSTTTLDYLELCRLCLVKERANVPIFEDEGDVRQIFLKIAACLPVKVSRDDKLPKKICDDCVYKVELFYQFWNTTANAEKQLLEWLGDVGGLEDKEFDVLDTNVMKQEGRDNRLDGSVMQISGHQNNMEIGIIDNMSIIQMPDGSEQFTAVPMDASTTIQVVGSSTQVTHDQSQVAHIEEVESEIEDNSDDGCDNEEGLPVKEETEEEQASRAMETQFVTISGDQAGPSGLQQQKMKETQRNADDPKTQSSPPKRQIIISKKSIILDAKQGLQLLHPRNVKIERIDSGTCKAISKCEFEEVTIDGTGLATSAVSQKTSNNKIVLMCQSCNTFFPNKQMLEDHHLKIHQNKKIIRSKTKDNSKDSKKTAPRGYFKDLEANEYVCSYCPYRSPIRSTVASHAKRTHENPAKAQNELDKTVVEKLIVEEEGEIEDEGEIFKLEISEADEDDEASWPIETVDENFDSKSNNLSDENEEQTRTCPYCPFETSVSSTYHSHVKRKHREAWLKDMEERLANAKPPEGPELSCPHCNFKTHKRNTLHSHVKRKHGFKRKREEEEFEEFELIDVKQEDMNDDEEEEIDDNVDPSKLRNCPYCEFKTLNTAKFNAHILRKHTGQIKKSDPTGEDEYEEDEDDGVSVPRPPSRARASTRVNNFMMTGYACHYCTFMAATLHSIASHNAKVHAGLKQAIQEIPTDIFDCDRCEHKSRNRRHMQTHLKKNHKSEANADGMFACNSCSYETMSHMGLQRHISIKHHKVNLTPNTPCYQCEVCEYSCLNLKIMNWHLKSHNDSPKPDDSGNTFVCNDCDFSTWTKTLLHSHIRRKHKEGDGQNDTIDSETLFICEQCDYSTKNKHVMKVHVIRKHTENYSYECEICGKKYKVKADLTNHVRFKHREQPIICDVCGKTCQNSNLLYLHQKFAHYKPEFECHICHRRMVSQANLDDHILKQHEQREDAVCEECGKTFTRAARLKIHMRVHTGVKPYSCNVCLKSFARRNGLRQHLLIHTGKRPYLCDICGKSFTQKTGLISHRKSHPGTHPPLPRVTIDHVLTDFLDEKPEF